jgi:uncharacterized damage-inducible protein DinB
MTMRDFLLPEFDHETALTRRLLERVPMADAGWKPHPKSYSLGELATHIGHIYTWAQLMLRGDSIDLQSSDAPARPTVPTDTAGLLDRFDRNVAAARALLAETSDAEMMAPWTLRAGEHVVFTMPRAAVLRSFIFSHAIHHRGQLTVYLRMRDVPLPSIYGPSADEK